MDFADVALAVGGVLKSSGALLLRLVDALCDVASLLRKERLKVPERCRRKKARKAGAHAQISAS